jgi:prepilin-type N-terminal cleavage/methylation domain-containing protein
MKNKKGFTLVEMLAVVIIIGILTAIALPQYRRAIQKAKATEALVMLRTINDSAERLAALAGYRDFARMAAAVPARATFPNMDMFDSNTLACTVADQTLTCGSYTYSLNRGGSFAFATKNNAPYQGTQFRLYREDNPRLTCVGTQEACDLFNIEKEEVSTGGREKDIGDVGTSRPFTPIGTGIDDVRDPIGTRVP